MKKSKDLDVVLEEEENGSENESQEKIKRINSNLSNLESENSIDENNDQQDFCQENEEEEEEEEENHSVVYLKCPYWLELIVVYGVFFLIIFVGSSFKKIKIVRNLIFILF